MLKETDLGMLGAEYILNIYTEIFMDFILIYFMFINYIYIQTFVCISIHKYTIVFS